MNRRDVIKSVGLALGGTLSAPTLMAMSRWEQAATSNQKLLLDLTDTHRKIMAEVAEMIIPKTNTPGAKDVGVPAFIEMMLKDCYKAAEHQTFTEGLTALEKAGFLAMDSTKRTETLKNLEANTKDLLKANPAKAPFWRLIKELTLLGYFSSEAGIKASFEYVPIPSKLQNIKLKPNQKAYAY